MKHTFVRQLVVTLQQTPWTAWEQTIYQNFGGERYYIPRRDPQPTEQVRALAQSGMSERTARLHVRGK